MGDIDTKNECLQILKNILSSSKLSYKVLFEKVVRVTDCENIKLFLLNPYTSGERTKWKCEYNTEDPCDFNNVLDFYSGELIVGGSCVGKKGSVFLEYKEEKIGILQLSNKKNWETLNQDTQKMLNDIICTAILLATYTDNKYNFIKYVCLTLSNIVDKISFTSKDIHKTFFKTHPKRNDQVERNFTVINSYLSEIMNILYDTIDYIEISENKINITKGIVESKLFCKELLDLVKSLPYFKTEIQLFTYDTTIPKYLFFDEKHVQQLMLIFFKNIKNIEMLKLDIKYTSDKIVFHIYSKEAKNTLYLETIYSDLKIPIDGNISRLNPIKFDSYMFHRLVDLLNVTINKTDGLQFIIPATEL